MRITALLMMLLAAVILVSCSKKEVKPTTLESRTALEAFALADGLKDAFMKKDIYTIRQDSTDSGYESIISNRKAYDSVELTFTPRWVEIDQDKVMLNIAWKSTWTAGGKETPDRGMTVFVLEGRPLKLSGILRTNPFIFPAQKYSRP